MDDPRIGDHVTGLELQIEELVVRRDHALAERRHDEVGVFEAQIADLHLEVADVTEHALVTRYQTIRVHGVETAGRLAHPAA